MKKFLLLISLFLLTTVAFSQYPATRQNVALVREERYVSNSPGNGISNSKLIEYSKDSTQRAFLQPLLNFSSFGSARNDGQPISIAWFDNSGNLKRSPFKKQEAYTGTTNTSGIYSMNYSSAFTSQPIVVPSIITNNPRDVAMVTASSTTGFTIQVQRRVDVLGLLPSYTNLSGIRIDVFVIEP